MLLPLVLVVLLLAARVWVCVGRAHYVHIPCCTPASLSNCRCSILTELVRLRDELKVLKVIMNSEEMLPCPMYLHGCTLASSVSCEISCLNLKKNVCRHYFFLGCLSIKIGNLWSDVFSYLYPTIFYGKSGKVFLFASFYWTWWTSADSWPLPSWRIPRGW